MQWKWKLEMEASRFPRARAIEETISILKFFPPKSRYGTRETRIYKNPAYLIISVGPPEFILQCAVPPFLMAGHGGGN